MKRKIVFILESTFNQRDYHRNGFEILKNRGYKVIALDLTPFLRSEYFNKYSPPDTIHYDDHIFIYSKNDAIEFLSQLNSRDVAICIMGIGNKNIFIYDTLNKYKVKYGFKLLGLLPQEKYSITEKLGKLIKNPKIVGAKIKVLIRKNTHLNNYTPNFIIYGGKETEKDRIYPIGEQTQIIKAHAYDYDRYLEEDKNDKNSSPVNSSYAVFLDSYIPYHPDYLHANIKPYCQADKYYSRLNTFFNFIENELSIEVVIAAHPRANYNITSNPFNKRKIVRSSTAHLVKYSKAVLAHNSSSINFAVLYNKPILFLSDKVYTYQFRKKIDIMAKAFGKETVNLASGKFIDLEKQLSVNIDIYNRYKESYIKELNTPKKPIWEIFADYCEKI